MADAIFPKTMDTSGSRELLHSILVRTGESTRTIRAIDGESLLNALRLSGVAMPAPCGGNGTCGKCGVAIDGEGTRNACTYRVLHDLALTVPDRSRAAIAENCTLPLIDSTGSSSGLTRGPDNSVMYGGRVLWVDPPSTSRLPVLGAAVDIGTTTVVICLDDLSGSDTADTISFINPQTVFGGDVVSRIQYATDLPGGLESLRSSIVRALDSGLAELCKRRNSPTDRIARIAVAGNTTMLHLLLGIDPSPIALAPYTPRFTSRQRTTAVEVGLHARPGIPLETIPSVSGYVGADIVSGLAVTPIPDSDRVSLYIDLGTNGELVLGNRRSLLCCATAAGPAFEGARIQCGIGGIEGAIASYHDGTYRTIGGALPVGICGSGLVDLVAELLETGLIDSSGYLERDFRIEVASKTQVGHDIVLTPADIREVQLAKAAIHAGIEVMMGEAGIGFDQIECVYLAGGFGTSLRVESAVAIGLIPAPLERKCVAVGNASLHGARMALRSMSFDARLDLVANACRYIELSTRPDFMDRFVAAMGFDFSPTTTSVRGGE